MADSVNILNWPKADSAERVAFDLAVRISTSETSGRAPLSREAMLKLFAQCLQTVRSAEYSPPKA